MDESVVFNPSLRKLPQKLHNLRGWRLYFYEISWPSALISFVLLIFSHFVDLPDFENWHYNKHNEWSFDFKETKQEIVPFRFVLYFGVLCGFLIGLIERQTVRCSCVRIT